jgi:hypothetical protein
MNNIIEGLQIFASYGCTYIGTDYYGIFSGNLEHKYSKEDKRKLKDLGWSKDDSHGCYYHFV